MEKLTRKEEELMTLFWENGAMFVREAVELYPEPRPHFNTVSTMVRSLEAKGYLAHKAFGNTYQYYPAISAKEFSKGTLSSIVGKYFQNSYMNAVSALVKDEKITVEELEELIRQVQNGKL